MELKTQSQNQSDTVLLISSTNEKFLSKVEAVASFSQYLINPLKRNYSSFHLSMTILFKAIHSFLPANTTSKAIIQAKAKIFQPLQEELFAPTIDHVLDNKPQPT